jgi:hypothetical protein
MLPLIGSRSQLELDARAAAQLLRSCVNEVRSGQVLGRDAK